MVTTSTNTTNNRAGKKTVAPAPTKGQADAAADFQKAEAARRAIITADATAWVTAQTLAAALGCHVGSIWRMSKQGRIPAPTGKKIGRTFWHAGDLVEVLQ